MQQHPAVGARLSAMMFLEFFVWGAWYITVGNYMGSHGMFDSIAAAYTVGPIAAIVSPFFLGMIADRFFATERVLGVLHILGGITMLLAPVAAAQGADAFLAVLLVHMLCYMPTINLTNSLAFANIANPEKQFPIIRVFGTIGWIAANWTVLSLKGDFTAVQFYLTGGAGIALGLYSFTLPHTPPPAKGQAVSIRKIIGVDALSMLKNPSFAVFVLCAFLICIPLAAYYAYAPVFVAKVGYTPSAVMPFGQVSEIFFMLIMPLCFARLGVKWMLAVGMLAWAVRYGLFAGAHVNNIEWMVLIGVLLHGLCFDFFFVTGFIYTDKKAPPEIRGQAQGFLVLMMYGLGLGIGANVMGKLVAAFTPAEAAALQAQSAGITKQAFATADPAAAKTLFDQAGELGAQAAKMIDWQSIWLYPAIAAGVIMVIFIALFHDRVDRGGAKH